MIFRWSIWGDNKEKSLELLEYSILSFKKYFGDNRYVVFTDQVDQVFNKLGKTAEIVEYSKDDKFNINSKATWKKWCPKVRLNIDEHEIYVDSDVFLVNYPTEIFNFLEDKKYKFAILDEFKGQSWQHGAMHNRATDKTPFVNAGLFIQKIGCDISSNLDNEFEWWKKNIKINNQTHHDEQGALAVSLIPYVASGELFILPKNKYLLIGENENTDIDTIENITLFHAVYPNHPAFYKFRNALDKILK